MSTRRHGTASAAALLALVATTLVLGTRLGTEAREKLCRHETDAQALDAQRVRVLREDDRTAWVAGRVADGTMPLAAAVDELEPIHRVRPGFECAWASDPPPTTRHRVARSVIERVATDLDGDPVRRSVVLDRLCVEYRALR